MNLTVDTYIPKVIAITGGKGGIGKTNIAVNLSVALAKLSQQVMLLDADLGLANVDVILGLRPKFTLEDVIVGNESLSSIILPGPEGIQIIPASSGSQRLVNLNALEINGLIKLFTDLPQLPNILVVDTSSGITNNVINLSSAADEVLIVICNDPSSITDAYALIKILNVKHKINKFRIITNKVKNIGESHELFAKLTRVADQFLNVSLNHLGIIPEDKFMERATRRRKALMEVYPNSASASAIYDIANKVIGLSGSNENLGRIKFFQELHYKG